MSAESVIEGGVPEFQLHHRMALAIETAGVAVNEIAGYLDVNPSSVSRWVNGKVRPGKQTLRLWALRTGVPLEWLETGKLPRVDSNHQPAGSPYALARTATPLDDAAVIDITTRRRVA